MKVFQKFLDIVGKLLALVWIVNFIVWATNTNWPYIHNATAVSVINAIKEYGAFLLVAVVGCEAIARRRLVTKIIFFVLLAACIVFMFFSGVLGSFLGK